MYHNYKHKGGGYFKGRSKSGRFYTGKFPPFPRSNSKNSGTIKPGVFIAILVVLFLFCMFLIINLGKR